MNTLHRTATMAGSRMKQWFPGTSYPLIVSAPMDFVTNPKLATEVVKAGGLGFIQGGREFSPNSPVLQKLDDQLNEVGKLLNVRPGSGAVLPIGVGFVAYSPSASLFPQTTTPVIARHRPAAVWLFAPSPEAPKTLPSMVASLRAAGSEWGLKIVVQVGTVASARAAVEHGVDVIVAQGTDAGGHQFAAGAGIVSLVPEIKDMCSEYPDRQVAVWAAGGIADGRGVTAVMALGAEAAVLGTRYMVASESDAQDFKRQAILSTSDGGANTVKHQIHDHVQGNMEWPDMYDGRAVVHASYHDHKAGVPLKDNTKKFKDAKEAGDVSRMVTWSGTGVGLIKHEMPAAQITKQVREGALNAIKELQAVS
ncbi:FMN-dependent 2-nitropropane dioxygenase [Xylariaceae sp. FL0016]|nr:FMN-dependent 2-nitropropane dioxygenase [Xylariaceae sp. FL0016]